MKQTRIKICGITRPEDALVAVACGADAIGLVFYPKSPRAVSIEQAVKIAAVIPPFVAIVALFVDESVGGVERVLSALPVDHVQFHGDESPQYCHQFKRSYIKALRVKPGLNMAAYCAEHSAARGILLDSWQEGVPGGTGISFDWNLVSKNLSLPLILAGGLTTDNVADAIHTLRPVAVDVSGGVELSPGIKSEAKIEQFISAVRAADQS